MFAGLNAFELNKASPGNLMICFAGRVRYQVKMNIRIGHISHPAGDNYE
jgi:hypothetical protein